MSRYWYALIGALLLVLIIGVGMGYVYGVTGQMEDLVKEAQTHLEQENYERAKTLLQDCNALWEKKRNRLEAIVDHSLVEQVNIPLSEAQAYLQYGKIAHCAASCQHLLQTLRALRDGQQMGFYNLF